MEIKNLILKTRESYESDFENMRNQKMKFILVEVFKQAKIESHVF